MSLESSEFMELKKREKPLLTFNEICEKNDVKFDGSNSTVDTIQITNNQRNVFNIGENDNMFPDINDKFYFDEITNTLHIKNDKGLVYASILQNGNIMTDRLIEKIIEVN